MKILQLSHYYTPHLGGVEKHLAKVNQELLKAGHKVTVLTTQHDAELSLEAEIDGVRVKRFPVDSSKYWGLLKIWWQLLKRLNFFRQFDLIQIHDVFIWFLPLRVLLPFKPIFMTFHGYIHSPISVKEQLYQRLAASLTTGNLCIGDFIPQHFGIKADAVSYGAVDLEQYRPSTRDETQPRVGFDALFIGRFAAQTGLSIYLAALRLLQKKQPFKTLFLGDGDQQLKAEAKQLGQCLGWVKTVAPYLSQTQFVFASRYLSILEAFAAQKLVFAVYQPQDEVKRDYLQLAPFAQWLVIAQTADELAAEVRYYQTHPTEAAAKTKAAFKWVQTQTWSQLTQKYQTLWYSTETHA